MSLLSLDLRESNFLTVNVWSKEQDPQLLLMDTVTAVEFAFDFACYIHSTNFICYCLWYVRSWINDERLLFFPQEKVKAVFDNLIQLEHLNIVKFHKYWADVKENRARVKDHLKKSPFSKSYKKHWMSWPSCWRASCCVQVIFITEYMSSGSLKQFLKKTKKNHKTMNEKVWKFCCICSSADFEIMLLGSEADK